MKIHVTLISGLLCDESVWTHQIKHLGDIASIEVICPDQETPQKMVEGILKRSPSKFALAGHSMGGWLSLEVMRKAPERVTHLALLNTTAKPDTPEKQAKRKEMILKVESGHFTEVVEKLVNDFVYDRAIKEKVELMFHAVGAQAFIRQEKSMLQREECLSILPTIHCPTLVVHAEKDRVFKLEDHQELAKNIAKAELSILQDCGHMSPMEKPEAITSLLRAWLKKC